MEVEDTPELIAGKLKGLLARIIGWLTASDLELRKMLASLLQGQSSSLLLGEPSLPVATSAPR